MNMKRQIVKAATSSGVNYEESQGSPTKPDAKTKIDISLKEIRKSNYFLRIFNHLSLGYVKKCSYLVQEPSEELKGISKNNSCVHILINYENSKNNKQSDLRFWDLEFGIWNLGLIKIKCERLQKLIIFY